MGKICRRRFSRDDFGYNHVPSRRDFHANFLESNARCEELADANGQRRQRDGIAWLLRRLVGGYDWRHSVRRNLIRRVRHVQIAIQENTKNRRRREHWIRTDVDVRLNGWLVSLHGILSFVLLHRSLTSGTSSVTSKREVTQSGPTHCKHRSNVWLERFVPRLFAIVSETHATSWIFVSHLRVSARTTRKTF